MVRGRLRTAVLARPWIEPYSTGQERGMTMPS